MSGVPTPESVDAVSKLIEGNIEINEYDTKESKDEKVDASKPSKDQVKKAKLGRKTDKSRVKNFVDYLTSLNKSIQSDALMKGTNINKFCRRLDSKFEPLLVGQCHRAAGILTYRYSEDGKFQVLLVNEGGSWTIPGGKGQGDEYPLVSAVREFEEELNDTSDKKQFKIKINKEVIIASMPRCYYFVPGKYTLFLIPEDTMFQDDILSYFDKNQNRLMWDTWTIDKGQLISLTAGESISGFLKSLMLDENIKNSLLDGVYS